MNAARENILKRVRIALQREGKAPAEPLSAPIWPPIAEPLLTFQQEFTAIKGEIITDLPAFLAGFQKFATDESELVNQAFRRSDFQSRPVGIANTIRSYQQLAEADLGVTGCDCLIARTGSIAVSTRSAGGRALSVLPPVHLVIARRDQVVPDLEAAFVLWHRRYGQHWPSNLCIITGPSRTADIEKILVMGAHGPKRLAVYFVD